MRSIRLAFLGFARGLGVEAPEGLGSGQVLLLAVLRSLAGVPDPGQQQVLQALHWSGRGLKDTHVNKE